jgi:hypothetical protein
MALYRVAVSVTVQGAVLVEADSPDAARKQVENAHGVPFIWATPSQAPAATWETCDWQVKDIWPENKIDA